MTDYNRSSLLSNLFIFFFFLCYCPFSLAISYENCFSKIYAFGDSITDTGNTESSASLRAFGHVSDPPYGMTFFKKPTNRFSDGRLIVDFLAQKLGLPLLPPYGNMTTESPNGVNFAVGGATAIDFDFFQQNSIHNIVTFNDIPVSLGTEHSWFDKYIDEVACKGKSADECQTMIQDALFYVGEIGVNDYSRIVGSAVTESQVRDLAINKVTDFMQALLKRGAKYMIVQGLQATGCLPLAMAAKPETDRDAIGCVRSTNEVISLHNKLFRDRIEPVKALFPDATIIFADFWGAHRDLVSNAKTYGFDETFMTCCGAGGGPYNFEQLSTCGSPNANQPCPDPSKYVNWDGVHLTEAAYGKLADLFFSNTYCQPSFDTLFTKKNCA